MQRVEDPFILSFTRPPIRIVPMVFRPFQNMDRPK